MASEFNKPRLSARKLGFEKYDYALDANGFVCRLVNFVHTSTPFCEVWGLYHEWGSVYADELTPITEQAALDTIEAMKARGMCQE